MTERNGEDIRDREFIEELRRNYEPEPLSPTARRAFDAGISERIERPRSRRVIWIPAFAALAAALLFWLASPTPQVLGDADGWEYALLYPEEVAGIGLESDGDLLPEDYVAIASVFLE